MAAPTLQPLRADFGVTAERVSRGHLNRWLTFHKRVVLRACELALLPWRPVANASDIGLFEVRCRRARLAPSGPRSGAGTSVFRSTDGSTCHPALRSCGEIRLGPINLGFALCGLPRTGWRWQRADGRFDWSQKPVRSRVACVNYRRSDRKQHPAREREDAGLFVRQRYGPESGAIDSGATH